MQLLRSARWFLLALVLFSIPASSYAGVFISVNFAPPALPVYEQPPCPDPGLMWTPGYWAYGPDGYYWVPGAWVPAPYEGAMWTPGYWGWSDGLYVFHEGYWGPHVGYYGGVNYGFGYGGIGFVGGMWRGHDFVYNTAVMRVDERRIHNVYVDREIVNRYTVVNDRRVAFSGGPGGIRHDASPQERMAERDQHIGRTSFQQQHEDTFRGDRSSYFKNNNGRPANLTAARPLGVETHAAPTSMRQGQQGSFANRPGADTAPGIQSQPTRQSSPASQQQQMQPSRQAPQSNQAQPSRQAPQSNQVQPSRQAPQSQSTPRSNQAQPSRQAQQSQSSAAPKAESKGSAKAPEEKREK